MFLSFFILFFFVDLLSGALGHVIFFIMFYILLCEGLYFDLIFCGGLIDGV